MGMEKKKATTNIRVDVSDTKPKPKPKLNMMQCFECDTVVESRYELDFQMCACEAVFVDTTRTGESRFGWTEGKRYQRFE